MNAIVERAIQALKELPEDEQEELARSLLDDALRKSIDAKLREGEESGGEIPIEDVRAMFGLEP